MSKIKDNQVPVALQISTIRDSNKNVTEDGTEIASMTTWETLEDQD